ncbi:MAG TPA: D-glycero-beta-D-manno-heptose 1-phosphate adenylyltransferase [Saprospiraceae bacterium]|nr:D-glycero-beta-D-manno-heptose 1-phosphate adenylyltransferase [Saprospiraceae bacterium]
MLKNYIKNKILSWEAISERRAQWKQEGKKVVFTNGCFDILHYGHLHYLAEARDLGDILIVGANSQESITRLKGPNRPIQDELTRYHMLASLVFVDVVTVFSQDTPLELIKVIRPDILVKGGDWKPEQIIGSDIVLEGGGEVKSLPFVEGFSTTKIEQKIQSTRP